MLLTAKTILYVTGSEYNLEMNFLEFCSAVKGGLKLENVEITTDPKHSERLEQKWLAQQEVQSLMKYMTPEQAKKVVNLLRSDEDLMKLHDDYQ